MKRTAPYTRIGRDSGWRRRIRLTALIFGVLALIPIGLRLYGLMIRDYDYYSRLALQNQSRTTEISPERGRIYDRNMNLLASSQGVENVYLNPNELRQSGADLERISQDLADILDQDPAHILKLSKDRTRRYQQIGRGVDRETGSRIRQYINAGRISGIHLEPNVKRVYPYGTLACQVIGFSNSSGTGAEGIEASYDAFLSGKPGRVITTKGNNEMDLPFSYEQYVASQKGCDVVLTLDTAVQTCLEKQLDSAIRRYDVKNGAFGLIMNVNTGEILAMSTRGGYDPNRYLEILDPGSQRELMEIRAELSCCPEGSSRQASLRSEYRKKLREAQLRQWRNRCISDGYEPGSTFKVLTMAAALDTGAIDLNTDFYCRGSEQIPGRAQRLHCWRSAGHGSEKTPQALQNSCNIAFAHIALKLGGQRFYEYVKRFGMLEKTGIDLAGESKGVFFDKALVTDTEKWGTASLTSGSFGQTFKITPLQLVRGISAVVNGGRLLEPYVVSQVLTREGKTVLSREPAVIRQVIRPETSETMRALMESVVTEGTARNAHVFGYRIGGKTGTSEKIDVFDSKGRRVLDKIVSFVGVAPMDDPEYIVLVALDTPSRETGIYISGGVMAAPTVGAVMGDILPYLGVSRSYGPEDSAGRLVTVEDLRGLTLDRAETLLKAQGLTPVIQGQGKKIVAQIPGPGETVPGDGQVLLYLEQREQIPLAEVPDFTGMHRQQASDAAGRLGLQILAAGNDSLEPHVTAAAQSVPKGTKVPIGTTIRIQFTDTKAAD